MASDSPGSGYRRWYARLLRLYPKRYYERFGREMQQTFNDLLQEQAAQNKGLFSCAVWAFGDTCVGLVRERRTMIVMQKKRLIGMALGTILILLIPLLAMQFTEAVNWGPMDFVVAGVLLLGACLVFELVARKLQATKHRVAIAMAIGIVVLVLWAELAVGIFGTPLAGS